VLRRVPLAFAVVALVAVTPADAHYAKTYLANSGVNDPAQAIDAAIPVGSCVLSVDVVYALVSNRFTSGARCPALDDSYGTWIALNDGSPPASPPFSPALVATWQRWLEQADYFIYRPSNVKVPWTPALLAWFGTHYHLVAGGSYSYFEVYAHHS
jgi:hypothetical protein